MPKILIIISIFIGFILVSCSRIVEIYKPIQLKKLTWNEIYDLKALDISYVAQGIEVYKDYLLYTVHKNDESSLLLVFHIHNNKLKYLFTTNFPKIATHVSDLSMHKNILYAIDYASNNLYKINIEKTIKEKKISIIDTIPTHLKRTGSIILSDNKNKEIIFISQFILNNKIKVFNLEELNDKNKKELFEIKSKYFIQGLYIDDKYFYLTSNKKGADPIFITERKELFHTKKLNNSTTVSLNGPGRMIEDITVYNGYLITSDEETNKIYISKDTITNLFSR